MKNYDGSVGRHKWTPDPNPSQNRPRTQVCYIMEKFIIPIILVNIEIPIIQSIIFEFENMLHLFIIYLQKNTDYN